MNRWRKIGILIEVKYEIYNIKAKFSMFDGLVNNLDA